MNFLGHLYFSGNDPELMYANLFGDSVKGRYFNHYPEIIQKGIFLHRKIDSYIDQHPEVKRLKNILYPNLPKVTPVAIDLYFDHILAKSWGQYHKRSYDLFLDEFYQYKPILWDYYPNDFKNFIYTMHYRKWLNYYPFFFGLEKSCAGVSARISFPNKLNEAPTIFLKFEPIILETFSLFMRDANNEFGISN